MPESTAHRDPMLPPAFLLQGEIGTGKTTALISAIPAGLELFVLVTEGRGVESLLDEASDAKIDMKKLHYTQVTPGPPNFDSLEQMAKMVGNLDHESLSKLSSGIDKPKTQQYILLIQRMKKFIDQHGKDWGDISAFGDDKMFALDSLSGVSELARDLTVGYKPTMHLGEWGVAMQMEFKLMSALTNSIKCFFTLTAHLDKEPNQITGGEDVTMAALGKKNAPKIARMFSEIVTATRVGAGDKTKFYWSNANLSTVAKHRALPLSSTLEPNFKQIVDIYRARKANAAKP